MKIISLNNLKSSSIELAKRVQEDSSFSPDCILYVERAGRFIGKYMAEELKIPAVWAKAKRSGQESKSQASSFLQKLPNFVCGILRWIEIHLNIHKVSKERSVEISPEISKYHNVVIVDDALDTGNSIMQIIEALENIGFSREQLKVAVFNTSCERYLIQDASPNYLLYRNTILRFPWSSDSEDHDLYWALYEQEQ